jgi:energy-coupling factor transporter ATP-binding protein EcfA2
MVTRAIDDLGVEPLAGADVAVQATGVTRRFGDREVLQGIDLTLHRNEFVALLGRSGSGKSTLLRAFAGLDDGVEGSIVVPEQRSVVFQDARLLPWASVLDNVTLGLRGPPSGDGPRWPRSVSTATRTTGPGRCPAVRPSGPRWPGPWCASPTCCCSTSRSVRSTR